MAIKYGGKTIYSAMRGPCDEGWHIPLKEEWSALHDIWIALGGGANDGTNFGAVLKMPFTGYRANLTSNVTGQNSYGHYWSSTAHTSSNYSYSFILYPGTIYKASTNVRCYGESIRPFKDEPVIPDSSWTTLYTSDIYPAVRNIKWSSSLGLITITYEGTYITIADKNLGATQVRNSGDTLSEANCGKYYQRGNNYGFAWTGTLANTSTTQVDASTYGPGNYYSSNTFIKYSGPWDSSDNRNLWGGVTGIQHNPVDIIERYYGGKLVNDYSAMRGPCPEGFHVPKNSERSAVVNAGVSLGARTTSGTTSVTNFRTYLKLPNIVYLFPGNGLPGTGWTPQHRYYWGCRQTGSDGSGRYCDALDVVEDYGGSIKVDNVSSNHGCPVRPFKDKPVIPDSTWTTLYSSDAFPGSRNIKHSQSLGLITISYDGTYITIADKNAGATNVYNFGDTITSANGGGLYQWGNNYPFSIDGATTTSSTRVDTTGYGPGNYYSGNTFITGGVNDDWFSPRNRDLWGGITGIRQKPVKVIEVYHGSTKIWPIEKRDYYFSPSTFNEYQSLVDSVGSVQFVDTGKRFRFNDGVYIGNRTALDFNGTTMRTINLDTLTVTSSKSSSISGRVWYFGDNRILTRMGIADFDGNMITTFSTTYNSITPGDVGVVWANSGFDIYKGIVDGDNITFTKIGTGGTDQGAGWMFYGKLGAYLINNHDQSGSGYSSYIDPESGAITNFGAGSSQRGRIEMSVSGPDGKLYRKCRRSIGWGLMQKIGTGNEGIVGNSLSTSWLDYGNRWGKFLGNIVSGGMKSNNGTGNGYGSNNYFIATDGTLTKVQNNAFAYDSHIVGYEGFIDENGWIYPRTSGGGSGVILKTDKTFTDLNWKNPYLWR